MCVSTNLRCGLVENVPALNDVSHHAVSQPLILVDSQLDAFQLSPTAGTNTPAPTQTHCVSQECSDQTVRPFLLRWAAVTLLW